MNDVMIPPETIDDQCTTTSGSYSVQSMNIDMDPSAGFKDARRMIHLSDMTYVQDVYVWPWPLLIQPCPLMIHLSDMT